MKWDRQKKKNFPNIEIELNKTNHHNKDEIMEEVSIFQLWPKKQIGSSPSRINNNTHHGVDSGIESIQVYNII